MNGTEVGDSLSLFYLIPGFSLFFLLVPPYMNPLTIYARQQTVLFRFPPPPFFFFFHSSIGAPIFYCYYFSLQNVYDSGNDLC
jgi:hypothetical protein